MLTTRYKAIFNHFLDPLGRALVRARASPNALTLAGVVLSSVVCLVFIRARAVLPFCLAMLIVGCLDGLDGAVARASGRVTKFGAYLDAMADRYVESIVALSAAAVTGYWLLCMLVLIGSLLVSYAKARAAMEVPVSNLEWPDLMERAERGVLFILGLAAGTLVPWRPLGRDVFWWTLLLLSILIWLTVVQRVRRAGRMIQERA